MVLSRNNQRRRRVVIDEVANNRDEKLSARSKSSANSGTPAKSRKPAVDSRLYSFGADRRGQSKTTDFVPKRFLSFACVVLVLVASVGVLNLLACFAPSWQNLIGEPGRRMFSITGVGSLSSWFSSFLFIISGLASLQIYALRQHRCDDYRGTYRLWLWLAFLFMIASIHCVVDLGSVLQNVVYAITRQPPGEKGWFLIALKMAALATLIIRGLFEVKASRGSLAMVVIVWVAYSAATLMQIPGTGELLVVDFDTVYGNTILFATSMLLLSHITYARFVFMDSNGLLKPRAVKKKVVKAKSKPRAKSKSSSAGVGKSPTSTRRKTAKSTPTTKAKKSVERVEPATEQQTASAKPLVRPPVPKPTRKVLPVPVPAKTAGMNKTVATDSDASAQEILSISSDKHGKLSKAERRRQRKLEKRQRRAA